MSMLRRLLIALLCHRGFHASVAESRYRLKLVNPSRRVIAGRIESRVVCSRCGSERIPWKIDDWHDLTGVSLPLEDWEKVKAGEVTFPIE